MKRIIAFQTILGWINSCKTLGELYVAREAIEKIYAPQYKDENVPDWCELYITIGKQFSKLNTPQAQPIEPQKQIENDNN